MPNEVDAARAGMTLIEALMAVALTGVAILCAVGILNQVEAVSSQVLARASVSRASTARADFIRTLVAQASTASDSSEFFSGDSVRARFHTLCRSPRGWLERCTATISVVGIVGA
jgi:Tfp pilus assembly protein PilV